MPSSRTVSANGIEIFLLEQGEGPLVMLCHGWPELSYSWRHQIAALAAAGFHVTAPDMRGFGRPARRPMSMRTASSISSAIWSRW
jgi:pimeloyl-ACP methyl ester carboxylesterase